MTIDAPAHPLSTVAAEAARRRTFAIISHPDAGKTTLTEKLLLYGGAVGEAGTVGAGNGRRAATSDWMEIERRRGISVTSTVLRFEHGDTVLNLLDTPGHRDFSEDTLRVLAAADCAVMLLDAAKGVERQTLRLFEVARARRIPLITFVNKYDKPGMDPLAMLDHIEQVLDLAPYPITWPVGIPGDFRGVVDRRDGAFHRFTRTARGATRAGDEVLTADEAREREGDAWTVAEEELELLDAVTGDLDLEAYATGAATPVFFGSAVSNFGVGLLLDALLELAPSAQPRPTVDGPQRDLDAPFAGFVFKVQANMDRRHRDRVAFLRVCSGRFERGMKAVNARTGRPFTMAYAHEVFGDERASIDEAFPGDVVGVVNAAELRVGDTLYAGDPARFPPIPSLAPEHFVTVSNLDTTRRKHFQRGLDQLAEEGVIHLLRRDPVADPTPILAGVGPLQFEVAVERLRTEFGVPVRVDHANWSHARRTDAAGAEVVRTSRWAELVYRSDGMLLALFAGDFALDRFERDHPDVLLDRLLDR
ncbi:peptide chain release factor 3 [Capillimicrobium parvum]|uniref:Peptide chain release factor 3 n=1 Tax=Capillimicrobium parvum TaxID=2884022 RepID=A0A9E6XW48_9ACTN|nr:peptide chain release factor 3 [Capillimicrobium parvum]UGS35531.1 Peptide chain release factor 3 [Capillimicrobium parvum]